MLKLYFCFTADLEAQKARFISNGWGRAEAWDMLMIYTKYLDQPDVRRIERIEMFDEFEEWDLILSHYCIALGINDPNNESSLAKFGLETRST